MAKKTAYVMPEREAFGEDFLHAHRLIHEGQLDGGFVGKRHRLTEYLEIARAMRKISGAKGGRRGAAQRDALKRRRSEILAERALLGLRGFDPIAMEKVAAMMRVIGSNGYTFLNARKARKFTRKKERPENVGRQRGLVIRGNAKADNGPVEVNMRFNSAGHPRFEVFKPSTRSVMGIGVDPKGKPFVRTFSERRRDFMPKGNIDAPDIMKQLGTIAGAPLRDLMFKIENT